MEQEESKDIDESNIINEEVEEEVIEEPVEEPQEEPKQEPKPVESPEDKAARLLRQTNQARKKLGLAPVGEAKPTPDRGDISPIDLYALIEAKVPQDDIKEVQEYAQLKKISVAEALKSTVVRAILGENAEKRKTADATNTAPVRRGTVKISDEQVLEKARKGEFTEDVDTLAKARLQARKDNIKR